MLLPVALVVALGFFIPLDVSRADDPPQLPPECIPKLMVDTEHPCAGGAGSVTAPQVNGAPHDWCLPSCSANACDNEEFEEALLDANGLEDECADGNPDWWHQLVTQAKAAWRARCCSVANPPDPISGGSVIADPLAGSPNPPPADPGGHPPDGGGAAGGGTGAGPHGSPECSIAGMMDWIHASEQLPAGCRCSDDDCNQRKQDILAYLGFCHPSDSLILSSAFRHAVEDLLDDFGDDCEGDFYYRLIGHFVEHIGGLPPPNPPGDEALPPGEGGVGGDPPPGTDPPEVGHSPLPDCQGTLTHDPVDIAQGAKSEAEVDLRAVVCGAEFGVTRHDTSNPMLLGAALAGVGQTLSPFVYIHASWETTPLGGLVEWHVTLFDLTASRRFETDHWDVAITGEPTGEFRQDGPSTDYFIPAVGHLHAHQADGVSTVTGPNVALWRRILPGKMVQEYYRLRSPWQGDYANTDILNGLLKREIDPYGNTRDYIYKVYGPPGGGVPRLDEILINDSLETGPASTIQFVWRLGGPSENLGRVSSIRVLSGSEQFPEETQRVEYTYKADGDGLPDSLGTAGDLIQVAHFEHVDRNLSAIPGEPWRVRVWQYRYHGGLASEAPGRDTDGDGFIEIGGPHQLKMILLPEQIEYFVNHFTPAVPMSFRARAQLLLGWEDAEVAFAPKGEPPVRVVDMAAKVVAEYEPDGEGRVKTQYVQTTCGCGGGSAPGRKITYEYWDYAGSSSGKTVRLTEYILEDGRYDTRRFTTYDDLISHGIGTSIMTEAVFENEDDPNGRKWVTHYEYDAETHQPTLQVTPAAVESYIPSVPPKDPGGDGTPPVLTLKPDGGLRYHYEYNDEKYLTKSFVQNGSRGPHVLLTETVYGDPDAPGGDVMKHLPQEVRRYRSDSSTADDDVETTRFSYGFYPAPENATFAIAWRKTTVETEPVAENGPGAAGGEYYAVDLLDQRGNLFWSRGADGSLTFREFDAASGRVTRVTANAAPVAITSVPPHPYAATGLAGASVPGWGRDAAGVILPGGELTSRSTYDLLGRLLSTTTPGNVTSYVSREMRAGDPVSPGSDPSHYAVVTLPHAIDAGKGVFGGPATVTWYSADDKELSTRQFRVALAAGGLIGSGFGSYPSEYALAEELSRSTTERNLSGQAVATSVWEDVEALPGPQGGPDTTRYHYDSLGRLEYLVDAHGTVQQTIYDSQNRKKSLRIGVFEGAGGETWPPTSLATVAEYFYDGEENNTHATGNGNLTLIREHVNPSTVRETRYRYDYRDRLIATERATPPHEFVAYDNLDRVVKHAAFAQLPAGTDADLINSPAALIHRLAYGETAYSQRGLVYRSRVAIDPIARSPQFLETHTWYDSSGRAIAVWTPDSPGVKTRYDGLGRALALYTTDRRGDAAPGTAGSYLDAATVGGANPDIVLKQVTNRYNSSGLVDLATVRRRAHDAPTDRGGALDSPAFPATGVIASYVGYFHDDMDRVIRMVNFGTNTPENTFRYGGTAPAWPPTLPPSYDSHDYENAIVTASEYDLRGRVASTTDAKGHVTRTYYDDLNRSFAIVENFEDVHPSDIVWTSADGGRWRVTHGLNPSEPDVDRVTTFVYDSVGHLVKQVAHQPGSVNGPEGDVQVTEYVYGVTTPGSELSSNNLLDMVIYPEESHGAPGILQRTVSYTYNRQGQRTSVTDQNQTRHVYQFDVAGRVVLDGVTAFGDGVDTAIDAIETTYDELGRQKVVRSRSGGVRGAVRNAVQFDYNSMGDVDRVWQQHDGEVQTQGAIASAHVSYEYDLQPMSPGTPGLGNRHRLTDVTYPDGTTAIQYQYGPAGSVDDLIARVSGLRLADSVNDLVRYSYMDVGVVASVQYVAPDLKLDRSVSSSGQRTPGVYPGFDRFGRIARQLWVDGQFAPHAILSGMPNLPPIVNLAYQYDKAGNVTHRDDERPGAVAAERDERFVYDGLDRVTEQKRGVESPGASGGSGSFLFASSSQRWTLDTLGNWKTLGTHATPSGSYSSTETRQHNGANELISRDEDGAGPQAAAPLAYDAVGNIVSQQVPSAGASGGGSFTYVHDAWNRIVAVNHAGMPRARYVYNGLHWRIVKQSDTPGPGGGFDGVLDQQRIMLYSAGWKLLQEQIYDNWTSGTPGAVDRHTQYVWGIRGSNDALMYRVDTNGDGDFSSAVDKTYYELTDTLGSVIALLDPTGAVVQRTTYDAYGQARAFRPADLNGDGMVDETDHGILAASWSPTHTHVHIADLNRDGMIDDLDAQILAADIVPGAPPGQIALPGIEMTIGYAGYVFNPELQIYSVGFRHYDPVLGRWLERDPAGYVDGMSLYLYVMGNPMMGVDPLGLAGLFEFLGLGNDVSAPHSYPNIWNYADSTLGGYYSSLWENTGGQVCSAVKGVTSLATEAGVLAADMTGLISPETALENSRLQQALTAAEDAHPNLSEDQVWGTMAEGAITGIGDSLVEFGENVASGDPDAIGTALRIPAETFLGARAFKAVGAVGEVLEGAAARGAAESAEQLSAKLYHYTTTEAAEAIAEQGLRPGASGRVFLSPQGELSPLQAHLDLALPPNRAANALFEVDVGAMRQVGIEVPAPTSVGRSFNMPGGGLEVSIGSRIPPELLRRIR